MDILILIGMGALGILLVGRYIYRAVVKGEPGGCSGCSHCCSIDTYCPADAPPEKQPE